jgi:hypothetical protein
MDIENVNKFKSHMEKLRLNYNMTELNQRFLSDTQLLDFKYLKYKNEYLINKISLLVQENKIILKKINNKYFEQQFLLFKKYYEFEMFVIMNEFLRNELDR